MGGDNSLDDIIKVKRPLGSAPLKPVSKHKKEHTGLNERVLKVAEASE